MFAWDCFQGNLLVPPWSGYPREQSSGQTCGGEQRGKQSVMAPRYAPSLRSRLPALAMLLQIIFILLFAFFVEIENLDDPADDEGLVNSYASK